jgi:peptidoglycan/xylan/chitin deacetylase (PgdA/CDA1 family)
MNYSFPEKMMLRTRKAINACIFTKKVNAVFDKAAISFTFDDVPVSAFDYAVPILDKYNCKATFYLAGCLCKDDNKKCLGPQQVVSLLEKGHEIGCHTFSHLKSGTVSQKKFANDLWQNKQFFAKNFQSLNLENFSYPNGSVGLWSKPTVNKTYSSARTTCYGINVSPLDLGFLLAYKLYSCKLSPDDIDRLIDIARKSRGWLIFYTHDVCPKPSNNGCEPELFEYTLRKALENGEVLNIRDVLKKIATHQ